MEEAGAVVGWALARTAEMGGGASAEEMVGLAG